MYDVVIIGAGVSGVFLAYTLASQSQNVYCLLIRENSSIKGHVLLMKGSFAVVTCAENITVLQDSESQKESLITPMILAEI
ncbi:MULTISPECIES: FAD-binding protein [Priestia]|uniref:FAD-binding protein n=1 Tax=Priestia TaxID=2800373 RepID=UPI001112A4C4